MPVRRRADNNHWLIDFRVAGTRYRETLADPNLTKREAAAVERLRRNQAEAQALSPGHTPGWADAAAAWWEQHAKFLGWADTVKWHLEELSDAVGDGTPVAGLGAGSFAQAVSRWRSAGMAPGTINNRLAVARSLLNHARDVQGLAVPTIPWHRLKLEVADRTPRHIPPAVREAILAECSPHVRWACQLAIAFGVRRASVLGLRWEDVDWEKQTVTFRGKSRKPGGAVHVLPMIRGGADVLQEIGPKAEGPVITAGSTKNGVYAERQIASIKTGFNRAKRAAGHPTVQFKDFRSSFGREVLEVTGNLSVTAALLGHSDPRLTRKHYARFEVAQLRDALKESA